MGQKVCLIGSILSKIWEVSFYMFWMNMMLVFNVGFWSIEMPFVSLIIPYFVNLFLYFFSIFISTWKTFSSSNISVCLRLAFRSFMWLWTFFISVIVIMILPFMSFNRVSCCFSNPSLNVSFVNVFNRSSKLVTFY